MNQVPKKRRPRNPRDEIRKLDNALKNIKSANQAVLKKYHDTVDTEFWFCVCFDSRTQKEEFLKTLGMDDDLKYITGEELARAVLVKLQSGGVTQALPRVEKWLTQNFKPIPAQGGDDGGS